MKQPLPIGISDFVRLRRQGRRYVDKSNLITEVMRADADVLLLPRPRRFGKTLAMTTLAAYLQRPVASTPDHAESDPAKSDPAKSDPAKSDPAKSDPAKSDHRALFEDLAVWRAGPDIRAHFARYPVLLLSFKDVKAQTWADCRAGITQVIGEACKSHVDTLTPHISGTERADLDALCTRTAVNVTLWGSLALLSRLLHKATGEPCVILIDEYDTPLHAALEHGYYADAVELFRNLLSAAFKDNAHLQKGVLTGILHVTKESIFSGLNNLSVHTLLSPAFSQHFGFTPAEVALLAEESGLSDKLPGIEAWYNGYNFGGQTVYNPWSVLSYLSAPEAGLRPYWINTASDVLLRELLVERGVVRHTDLEVLLSGGTITKVIDEHVVLPKLRQRPGAVWSLLLFSGYLKAQTSRREGAELLVELAVPNVEVKAALTLLFTDFMADNLGDRERVQELCRALLRGDGETFGELLETLMLASLSHHDVARHQADERKPEAVYQAFLLGLLVTLDRTHWVRSNREAGRGRYDLMVSPRQAGRPGVVLELKALNQRRNETVAQGLASAMAQLRDRDYAAELREQGADPVVELAAVFDGKRVWVQVG